MTQIQQENGRDLRVTNNEHLLHYYIITYNKTQTRPTINWHTYPKHLIPAITDIQQSTYWLILVRNQECTTDLMTIYMLSMLYNNPQIEYICTNDN